MMIRFKALEHINAGIGNTEIDSGPWNLTQEFGKYVFDMAKMRSFMTKEAHDGIQNAIEHGKEIDLNIADQVAIGMKAWAREHGATHYTHWFQPLTGLTAEKHDSFLDIKDGKSIEKFSGSALIQQEPDASSFPNGGIRNTFEARGYTAWDPSSPAFLMKNRHGLTLCIPTIFVSYTGDALDYKAPLLKALHKLERNVVEVSRLFDPKVSKAQATLGVEQEYFLVDAGLYNARPDLVISERTLFGHPPAKGQQLDDHYFGTIPERVHSFMVDFEKECLKLGIPLTTRHNEVAPSQYECAPLFEEVNLAVDHNQLLMDVIDRVARRHHLRALLHEKPFANVNGSGKHCNWSVSTDTGGNLLSPGKTPTKNLQFLAFFINTIKAVHEHTDLLRASIASPENEHRLGANEAPPAIISVFIGSQLTQTLEALLADGGKSHDDASLGTISIDVPKIPDIAKDNTDRNRTSPFAFTGNKFEFRAVGSSNNTSSPMTVLNTIVADQLEQFLKDVEAQKKDNAGVEAAVLAVLRNYLKESQGVLFEGNNYSDDWVAEAEKRGYSNVRDTPVALKALVSDKTIGVFERNKIMSARELEARYEIKLESYVKKIQIESRLMGEVALTQILPAALKYQQSLLENLTALNQLGLDSENEGLKDTVKRISSLVNSIKLDVEKMVGERRSANALESTEEMAEAYCKKVKPYFDIIRKNADKLELIVDDAMWPLPKYRELLFLR